LRQDIADMERMIQGYLDFARDQVTEPTKVVDVMALVRAVAETFRHDQVAVNSDIAGPLPLRLRPESMRRALGNIVANGLRHGMHCWIQISASTEAIAIIVDDDGPGIPDNQRGDIFRPFVRLDESRNAATGGVGLGLTIARDIALTHGGDIVVADAPQGGARFVLTLPR
jgi:two-component system osmolarity sensor histidine kinase EnvZ